MLIVLGYSHKDTAQALSLLRWMTELDGLQTRHELLLIAAAGLSDNTLKQVAAAARLAFSTVTTIKPAQLVETGWPGACNHLFRTAATYVVRSGKWDYFQWIEPDCIPLVAGAFDQVEAAYLAANKPFFGQTVHEPVDHLPGNAIYPAHISSYNPFIMQSMRHGIKELAWDCIRPELTLKHTVNSKLFQHVWVEKGTTVPQTFPDLKSLSVLREDALFFHRNKDHSLVLRLRERRALAECVKEQAAGFKAEEKLLATVTDASCEKLQMAVVPLPTSVTETASRPPIYTYFEKLLGFPDQSKLIELWRHLWSAQGWEPVVLGEKDAEKGSRGAYPRLLSAIMKLPTCNHRGYENACYMRHLAMANRGGGFLTDYDVMPVDFRPGATFGDPVCILEPTRVPCAVMATSKGYRKILQSFFDYQPAPDDLYQGHPHVSDMTILRKSTLPWTNACVEYLCSGEPAQDSPGDGWRRASMIHFSSASLGRRGRDAVDKVDVIEEVLAELKGGVPQPA